ncbi:sulfurtransferase complex subunit TusD [Marinospirillum sp. MEB164]|uniref:Sulfurtransferase complex subunit TusD n=1 Tax=Marinospirillum alkalitolerans TaxID=3123374 RepID=A0ABW8PYI4_9GAMM
MARFALSLSGSPDTSLAAHTALDFARQLVAEGHQLCCVFFYQDAVLLASQLRCTPQDETDLTQAWQDFAQQHQIELQVCIAAALKRGIINDSEAARHGRPHANLASGFVLTGLGQLIEAWHQADRAVHFHA